MKITILFTTSDWWISRWIRIATRSTVSHVAIAVDDIPDVGHEVYEAAWSGFRMSTRGKLTSGTTRIVHEIPIDIDPANAVSVCREWLETPYDYRGLMGQVVTQLGRLFGRKWPDPWASPHAMYCSEAASYLIQECATGPLKDAARVLDPRSTDPEMLLEFLEQTHA